MRKDQELILNALMNIAVALVAGGALKLILDSGDPLLAGLTSAGGALGLVSFWLIARKLERGRK